jgi:hypothetical protein
MPSRLASLRNSYGARPAAALLVVIGLVACGDGEATQRKAFIEFLHTRIIAKPGIHVPKLTDAETAALGEYAKHYAVIADFNGKLDQAVSQPLQRALEAGAPRSLDDLVARRSDIAAVSAGFAQVRAALDRELAAADAAHAALKQPDELKPVFDAAYERDVTRPAQAMIEIFPDVDDATRSILALADFLDRHRDKVKIEGPTIRVADPALQRPLSALVDSLRAKQEAIQKAKQRLHAVAVGG